MIAHELCERVWDSSQPGEHERVAKAASPLQASEANVWKDEVSGVGSSFNSSWFLGSKQH